MDANSRYAGKPCVPVVPANRSASEPLPDFCPRRTLDETNELVLEHMPLVRAVAARCRANLPAYLEFSDLVQAGIVGLLDAAHKYDPATRVSFSTYATHRIRGAILDSLRGQDPAPRKLRRRHRDLEKIRSELAQELQRYPTEPEISERSGFDLETLRSTALDIHHLNQMCGPDCLGAGADPEPVPTDFSHPEAIYKDRQRAGLFSAIIARLPESCRMVIVLHYSTDLTLKEISGSFGVPERQVSRIHKRALQRINSMLRAKGITGTAEL